MQEINREVFTKDAVFKKLYQLILKNHKVASHTMKNLIENKEKKGFCEEARHFVELPSNNHIYMHYDVTSWYKHPNAAQIKIESIGIYEDALEFHVARNKQLHESTNSSIPNIN